MRSQREGFPAVLAVVAVICSTAFAWAGPSQAALSPTPTTTFPELNTNGYVNAIATSGNTAYIGGQFTTVGGSSRQNLAAFDLTSGDVLSWNPGADGGVNALDVSGSDVYVGGTFTTIGTNSASRNYVARVDSDGAAASWDPGVNSTVNSLAVRGSTVYAGGDFTGANGCSGRGTTISTADGTVCDSALPTVNGTINSVAPDGSGGWYIAGNFSQVGTTSVGNFAHILSNKSVDTSWDLNVNCTVNAVKVSSDGSTVYIGGCFNSAGGQTRNNVAAVDAASKTVTGWNPNINGTVNDIELAPDDLTLYVGGSFNSVGFPSQSRVNAAAIDTVTAAATVWAPNPDGNVYSIAQSPDGSAVYLGGMFSNAGGAARTYLAAVNNTDGTANPSWDSSPNMEVRDVEVSSDGSTIYAGGMFTTIGGSSLSNLAAVNNINGNADPTWNPAPYGRVEEIELSSDGSTIYAGGFFWSVNGGATIRSNIAAFNNTDGTATLWNPGANGDVNALALTADGQSIYAGGTFTSISGYKRNRLAGLNTSDASATSWDPNVDGAVRDVEVSPGGSTIYASGSFWDVNDGTTRNNIAAFNNTDGTATPWNPAPSGGVNDIDLSSDGSSVYAGGSFNTVNGSTTRNYIAAFNTTNGTATSWNPNLGSPVNAVAVAADGRVYAAGEFNTVGPDVRYRLAEIGTNGSATSWGPTPDRAPGSLALSGSKLIVGASWTPFSYFGVNDSAVIRRGLAVFEEVAVPANSAAPTISGSAVQGEDLTCSPGTWSSSADVTYSYRWARNGADISQATSSTYTVHAADVGANLACVVTATNLSGSTTASSSSVVPTASSSGGGPIGDGAGGPPRAMFSYPTNHSRHRNITKFKGSVDSNAVSVRVAIQRVYKSTAKRGKKAKNKKSKSEAKKSCMVLKRNSSRKSRQRRNRFSKLGSCSMSRLKWHKADITRPGVWRLKMKQPLPAGSYKLYARAYNSSGESDVSYSTDSKSLVRFRVLRPRSKR